MKKTLYVLIGLLLMLAACSTVKLVQPTQTDVDRGVQKYSNLTLADLNQGKTIYEKECALCHGLKNPASKNEEKWKKIVPDMVQKVNKKKGKVAIDTKSEEILLQYLITMSTAPAK
jgi:cytochrome c